MQSSPFHTTQLAWAIILICSAAASAENDRRLELQTGDTVIFTGGTNMVYAQWTPALEELLTINFAAQKPHFRYMAWEADTVFHQERPLNFPNWSAQLKKVNASVIVTNFGQMESLAGATGLESFIDAYGKLLDTFAQQTKRIVVLSPIRFESPGAPLPDLTARNPDLILYVAAIRKLASDRGYLFIDVFNPGKEKASKVGLTSDGVHLTARGHHVMASRVAAQLGLHTPGWDAEVRAPSKRTHLNGCKIEEIKGGKDGVDFALSPDLSGVNAFDEGDKTTPFHLTVRGLKNGTYQMKIDGAEVYRGDASELAEGVDLNAGAPIEQLRRMREAMVAKNQDWFRYWRPTNWAFLNGDRTEQPSSRDHRDPKIRWFPNEIEEFLKLIAVSEEKIYALARPAPYQFELQPAK